MTRTAIGTASPKTPTQWHTFLTSMPLSYATQPSRTVWKTVLHWTRARRLADEELENRCPCDSRKTSGWLTSSCGDSVSLTIT